MLGALLAATVFGFVVHNVGGDPDIWWHLRNAEYLLTNHRFVRADMYSYTVSGHPWVNSEWLSEVPYYLAWRAFGQQGIVALTLVLAVSIVFGLFYLCWRQSGNIKGSALACYFAVFLAVVNFGPRTILFGYGYLIVLLIVLERFRSRGSAPLWLLPLFSVSGSTPMAPGRSV